MTKRDQRELRDGAGEAFSAAFEMIVTPAIFAAFGWFLDGRLGIFPIFTLSLAGAVFAYQVWKLCRRFGDELDAALEARRAGYGSVPVVSAGYSGAAVESVSCSSESVA